MDSENNQGARKMFTLENIPFLVLMVFLVLVPLFFTYSPFLSFQFTKSIVVVFGVILALVAFLIFVIKRGFVNFSLNPVFIGLIGLVLAYLITSITSTSRTASFLGYGFEIGTFFSILLMAVLAFLVSVTFNSPKKLLAANVAFVIVAALLGLFHISRFLFGPNFLSLGLFTTGVANTVGRWNELAIFFGIAGLISLTALELLKLKKVYQVLLYILLVVSLLILAVVNLIVLWYAFAFVTLAFFVYTAATSHVFRRRMAVSEGDSDDMEQTRMMPARRKIAVITLVVAIISILFITSVGQSFSQKMDTRFGINYFEVRPSWSASLGLVKDEVKARPLVGAGPNRFGTAWQMFRPDVNLTNFWSLSFDYAIGFVPTAFVEMGILGILAWIFFLFAIIYTGWRALGNRSMDQFTRYFVTSSFLVTLFLWIMNVVYTPGSVIFALSFFFTGLFLASSMMAGISPWRTFSFNRIPAFSFAVILVCVAILISSLGLGYVYAQKTSSSVYFQKGFATLGSGKDEAAGLNDVAKAIQLSPNDIYYRAVAQYNIGKINGLFASVANKTNVSDDEKNAFQNDLIAAIQTAKLAQASDPKLFENQAIVGQVYETILPVGVPGSYESAKAAYEDALKLSPRNPALYLALARLEASKNNFDAAEDYLNQAINLKANFVDAIFLQSQVDVAKKDLPAAIRSVQQIAQLTPGDPLIFFRLGLLKYDSQDFAGAAAAFQTSVSLVPVYANAKYFLGLSLAKIGKYDEAIKQFQDLKTTNPDNTEIDLILTNLEAKRDPFASAATKAIDSKPEKRKNLPVTEKQ